MIDSQERPLTGGCQCGSIRYEITVEPIALYACHCSECRRQSGSIHGLSLIATAESFNITKGEPKSWSRPTDQGAAMTCWFCGTCGNRIYHQSSAWPNERSVKAGTLDQPVDVTKAEHIWTASGLPSATIPPGAKSIKGEPGV